ncbi:hypothetical protein BLOT_002772 [Blomia tropicalis]|nr:hypothetical protein BLOT_002772 [Blomia tropicalis]
MEVKREPKKKVYKVKVKANQEEGLYRLLPRPSLPKNVEFCNLKMTANIKMQLITHWDQHHFAPNVRLDLFTNSEWVIPFAADAIARRFDAAEPLTEPDRIEAKLI